MAKNHLKPVPDKSAQIIDSVNINTEENSGEISDAMKKCREQWLQAINYLISAEDNQETDKPGNKAILKKIEQIRDKMQTEMNGHKHYLFSPDAKTIFAGLRMAFLLGVEEALKHVDIRDSSYRELRRKATLEQWTIFWRGLSVGKQILRECAEAE